jgi:anti-sigma factor RsiW
MTAPDDIHLLIQALADGELDAAAALDVERRIAADPNLAREYENVVALRKALENLPRPAVSDAFRARIDSLAPPPEGVVAAPAVGRPPSRTDWRRLAASVVLTALVASGVTYTFTVPPPDAGLASSIAGGHRRSLLAASPVDVTSSDRHTVKPWLDARIGLSPPAVDMADQGFALVGGRVDVVEDRAVPSLVYRHNEHLITLAAIPATGARSGAPEDVDSGGFNMVRWKGEGFTYWAVSDMERAELDAFVTALRTRIAQQ